MKYCRFCGKQIDDDAKFCPACGNSTDEFSEQTNPTYESGNTTTTQSTQNFHWMAVLGLILSILDLVPGLVFCILGLKRCTIKSDRTKCVVGIVIFCLWVVVGFILGVLSGLGIIDLPLPY